MKKRVNKFTKILLLITIIISDLMVPIKVLADEMTRITPNKGDVGINNTVSNEGNSATVYAGSYENEGDVIVSKTVSKTDIAGRYKVEFNVKGKELTNQIEITKPIYLVMVFDTSGSMICDAQYGCYAYSSKESADYWGVNYTAPSPYTAADGATVWCNNGNGGKNVLKTKWENAVDGATEFSARLAELGDETYISLVTFSNNASTATDFIHGPLNASDFGHPIGSTNLKQALANAKTKLDTITDENAQKYILVIGDGGPTEGAENWVDATTAAKNQADYIKEAGIKIFGVGYGIDNDTSAQNILKYISSNTTVLGTDQLGNTNTQYKDNGYYQTANSNNININLQLAFNEIGTPKNAGVNAVITDAIGSEFAVVATDDKDITVINSDNTVKIDIGDILSGNGTTKSFYVDIDPNAQNDTGWHNVNSGFKMSYTDNDLDINEDGIADTSTIIYGDNLNEKGEFSDENDPEVYWNYDFIINYYKDEITSTSDKNHYLGSNNLDVTHGDTITKDDLDLSYLLPIGYEFVSGNTSPISVSVDKINNEVQVINVLYTVKKFDYVINYYYADLNNNYNGNPESTIVKNNINYGTVVNTSDYYLGEVKEGYTLDSAKTNTENDMSYTITDNNVIIDIYYKRNGYNYTVNYLFNDVMDTDFTKNLNTLFGTTIKAEDNYLEEDKLNDKNIGDNTEYFINPSYPSNPNEIVVGTNLNENIINIYYVSTLVTNENINKKADIDKITASNDRITYTVDYKSVVSNIRKGDTVKVVIKDKLPLEIDESKSILNGGIYDASSKTITWVYETKMEEFTERYDTSRVITYTVVYKNVGNSDGSNLINNVIGQTTVGGKTTIGKKDSSTIEVEIPAEVIVHHYEKGTINSVAIDEKSNGQVGERYTTNYKTDILGYSVDMETIPTNANGVYTEDIIEVIYYYIKNDGTIQNTDIVKTSTDSDKVIDSINSLFGYTIDAYTEIKDYVGKATLKVVDTLPYEINIEKSSIEGCIYDSENKTITCRKEYIINEENYNVNDTGDKVFIIDEKFLLDLVFIDIDSKNFINNAKLEVILNDSGITERKYDNEDVKVAKGTVTATYKDIEGNILHEDVTTTDLAGKLYTTEIKEFYGYSLVEVPVNKEGTYLTNQTVIVNYVYTKNIGTSEEELIKYGKKEVEGINSEFDYTITYNTIITDYIGEATLVIIDELPYEIDDIKSIYNRVNCEYIDGKLVCTYKKNITREDNMFNIEEKITLYYKNITDSEVTNKVKSKLTYGTATKENNSEYTSVVKEGTVIVNYVNTNGDKLTDSIILTGMVGTPYSTDKKIFDKYNFIEVKGEVEGEYIDDVVEITYVYDLTPLPPQTGVEFNPFMIVKYLLFAAIIIIISKTYTLIKNN